MYTAFETLVDSARPQTSWPLSCAGLDLRRRPPCPGPATTVLAALHCTPRPTEAAPLAPLSLVLSKIKIPFVRSGLSSPPPRRPLPPPPPRRRPGRRRSRSRSLLPRCLRRCLRGCQPPCPSQRKTAPPARLPPTSSRSSRRRSAANRTPKLSRAAGEEGKEERPPLERARHRRTAAAATCCRGRRARGWPRLHPSSSERPGTSSGWGKGRRGEPQGRTLSEPHACLLPCEAALRPSLCYRRPLRCPSVRAVLISPSGPDVFCFQVDVSLGRYVGIFWSAPFPPVTGKEPCGGAFSSSTQTPPDLVPAQKVLRCQVSPLSARALSPPPPPPHGPHPHPHHSVAQGVAISPDQPLFDAGFDSLTAEEFVGRLQERLVAGGWVAGGAREAEAVVSSTTVFDCPTARHIAEHVEGSLGEASAADMTGPRTDG